MRITSKFININSKESIQMNEMRNKWQSFVIIIYFTNVSFEIGSNKMKVYVKST